MKPNEHITVEQLWMERRDLSLQAAQIQSQLSGSRFRLSPDERDRLLEDLQRVHSQLRKIKHALGIGRTR